MEQNRNISREWERWFARQFHVSAFAGGYEAACAWPGCPIKATTLGLAARGERRLSLGDAFALATYWERGWLLKVLGDMADGKTGPGDIERLAHQDVYDSADLAREVDQAFEDGNLTTGEIHALRQRSAQNVENAQTIESRIAMLKPGPLSDDEG